MLPYRLEQILSAKQANKKTDKFIAGGKKLFFLLCTQKISFLKKKIRDE